MEEHSHPFKKGTACLAKEQQNDGTLVLNKSHLLPYINEERPWILTFFSQVN